MNSSYQKYSNKWNCRDFIKKTHQLQCIVNRELVFDATAKKLLYKSRLRNVQ